MSQSKYTKQMAKAFHTIKKPYPSLRVAISEHSDYLAVRIYEDNIMSFSIDQRVTIMDYLELVRKTIESFGIRCEYEGVSTDPDERRTR